MKKNSYKEAILMTIMEEGYVSTHGLSMLRDNLKYIQKATYELTKAGYIADRQMTCEIKNRKYTVKYKAITKKGFEFVCKNLSDKYTYLKYIPTPLPELHIINNKTQETFYNQLQSINASILFKQIGISTVYTAGNNAKDEKNIKTIIYNAKRQDKTENGTKETLSLESVSTNYIHSKDIYPLLKVSSENKQQLIFTQQIGFLIYRSDSYIIYSAKKLGTKISYTMLKRVRSGFNKYLNNNGIETNFRTLNRGIILADTPTEWVNAFKNNLSKKNNKDVQIILDSIYLLPVGRDLVYMIDKVLYHSDNLVPYLKDILLTNDSQIEEYGGLKYKGREMVIGVDMDLCKLNSLYNSLRSGTDKKYTMVCFPWQEKYYRMVFPDDVNYYHINEECLIPPEYRK